MIYDLQRAMIWKRISAWLFDAILLGILAVGVGFCLSSLLGYDNYSAALNNRCEAVQQKYGVSLSMTQKEYENLLPQKQEAFLQASEEISKDPEARKAYSMMMHLSLMICSLGILSACLILEFWIPVVLGNGQTLGKKIFSIGVMSTNGVRVSRLQMFIRSILGKYTIEIMVPVLVGLLSFFGSLGIYGTMLILGLGILQLMLISFTGTNSLIHDLLAGTVAIDMPSQMIFESQAEMLAYKQQIKEDLEAHPYD